MNPVIAVAVDAPLRQLFDYRPPPGCSEDQLLPGVRLWVPFGRRRVVGLLVESRPASQLPQSRLKTALGLIDDVPVIDPSLLNLLRWASDYYRHPIGEVIAAALPAPLRHGAEALEHTDAWRLSAQAREGGMPDLPSRATRLRELVGFLQGRDWADAVALSDLTPRWREHVRELERRGWVTRIRVEPHTAGGPGPSEDRDTSALEPAPQPTPEQQLAIETIDGARGRFEPFLLHGITGSGKTEVYLRAIERVAAHGEQSLVLVPEISLTPQLVARFEARFGTPIVVLHSSL
ncbi:MAG TPA: DEAD/DEAH box helicase family protein, partial [Steroidobacteraceae bacterium]|nr:DEAD/DEAH box helicase family protein [Steroidobacteraceae bacterium]